MVLMILLYFQSQDLSATLFGIVVIVIFLNFASFLHRIIPFSKFGTNH